MKTEVLGIPRRLKSAAYWRFTLTSTDGNQRTVWWKAGEPSSLPATCLLLKTELIEIELTVIYFLNICNLVTIKLFQLYFNQVCIKMRIHLVHF